MKTFSSSYSVKTDLQQIFKFHLDPKNLRLVSTPNMNLRIIEGKSPIEKNSEIKIRFNLFPFISINWYLTIEDLKENELIIDIQKEGPFKFWRHKHHFQKLFDGTVVISDEIEYETGLVGKILNPLIKWRLKQIFKFRYKIIQSLFGG